MEKLSLFSGPRASVNTRRFNVVAKLPSGGRPRGGGRPVSPWAAPRPFLFPPGAFAGRSMSDDQKENSFVWLFSALEKKAAGRADPGNRVTAGPTGLSRKVFLFSTPGLGGFPPAPFLAPADKGPDPVRGGCGPFKPGRRQAPAPSQVPTPPKGNEGSFPPGAYPTISRKEKGPWLAIG